MISINKSPVPHLQTASEWDEFVNRVLTPLEPKRVLEIGSFFGATMWNMLENIPSIEDFYSIDLPIPPSDGRYEEMVNSRNKWEDWGDKIIDIQGDSHSQEILSHLSGKLNNSYLDLLFIDGDHSYDGVKMDYDMYSPFVREGGVIAFHDSVGYNTVRSFTNELKENNTTFEISHPNGWGIFILIKK